MTANDIPLMLEPCSVSADWTLLPPGQPVVAPVADRERRAETDTLASESVPHTGSGTKARTGATAVARTLLNHPRRFTCAKRCCGVLAALALATILSPAFATSMPDATDSAIAGGVPMVPFQWQGATIGSQRFERTALMVAVRVEGCREPLQMQLDLGTGTTVLYRGAMQRLAAEGTCNDPGQVAHTTRMLSVSGYGPVATSVAIIDDPGDGNEAGRVVGTVGSHFFRSRVLVIDFPDQRIGVIDRDEIPAELERMDWIAADYRDPHLFIPVSIGEDTYDDFVYDTGSSLFPMVTTEARWRRLTGSKPHAPDNRVMRVPSWDSEVVLVGARSILPITVGPATLDAPWVYFQRSGREDIKIENWDPPIDGLIGNVLFADDYLVAIDIGGERIGLRQISSVP